MSVSTAADTIDATLAYSRRALIIPGAICGGTFGKARQEVAAFRRTGATAAGILSFAGRDIVMAPAPMKSMPRAVCPQQGC